MISKYTISLIIPCKNEEASLYSMLQNVPSYIDEVVVIDNGSDDNTKSIARLFGAKLLTEKRQIDGVGYGYAHQLGMKHAKGDIIVAMDGDNTYPLEAIKDIILYMDKSKADFVSCSRFPLKNSQAISFIRQLGVKILNFQVSLLYGYRIKDILSGMWIMRQECVKKLSVTNGEWNFSPEIKLAAISHPDIHFSEYHINHELRLNGMSKQNIWKTGFNHLFYILKRRFTVDRVVSKRQAKFVLNNLKIIGRTISALVLFKFHTH